MFQSSIPDLAKELRDGRLTSSELTGRALRAAEATGRQLNAFVLVDRAGAVAAAQRADQAIRSGSALTPLTGIPIGVKDIIDLQGYPTRCGSPAYPDHPRPHDATVVRKLRSAGAVIVGKTTTHELACGVSSPPATNPWDTSRIPGGSSGGSGAAVASGVVPMALGSDTGGSIRIPASVGGIAGLKPTLGRVSKHGVEALSWSLDHIGPLASTVADCAITLQFMAGPDPADPSTEPEPVPNFSAHLDRGIEGLRIGVLDRAPFAPMQEDVEDAFGTAADHLAGLGAEMVPLDIPELAFTLPAEFAIVGTEAAAHHHRLLLERPGQISAGIRELFTMGTIISSAHYLAGLKARLAIRSSLRKSFGENHLDAVISPTLPATAALAEQTDFEYGDISEDVTSSYVRTTAPFNLSGQPALTVPAGFDRLRLPIGLQIAGRPFDEVTVLRIGAAYEATTAWSQERPPVHADRR